MGTVVKLAPTYACLGLGKFEKNAFEANNVLMQKIIFWKRFIDDVLMLFKGSESECKDLVTWLNSLLPGVIKFKYEFLYSKIKFLDLEISIHEGLLKTNLFVKPSNKQLFLDFKSNHCKVAIPCSKGLRVLQIQMIEMNIWKI